MAFIDVGSSSNALSIQKNFIAKDFLFENMDIQNLKRKSLKNYKAYSPGEQPPAREEWIKLNTNENPYPPPEPVIEEIKKALNDRLRLYPDPTCKELRSLISSVYLTEFNTLMNTNNVLVGLGSDEIIDLLFKAFIDPGDEIVFFNPAYGMYSVLTDFYNAKANIIELTDTFEIPEVLANVSGKLMFIDSPNNPSGKQVSNEKIAEICEKFNGLVIIDEAYGDFSKKSCLSMLKKHENLAVMRTLSKGYSLASQRIGFIVSNIEIIKVMNDVKLPYNVPYLSQVAAIAAIKHMKISKERNMSIIEERKRMAEELSKFKLEVLPSDANFLFIKMEERSAMKIFWELKDKKILVRHFNKKGLYPFLRISIGKPEDNDAFLDAFAELAAKYLT
ncbi:MAG: histidinol-phosphate transaminase [Promethearchaeota archaeon]